MALHDSPATEAGDPAAGSSTVFARKASGLVRQFSAFDVFVWVVGAPIASGLLFLPVATTTVYPGASFPLAFLIGAVIFLPMALLIPQMTAAMPRAGGLYVVVSRVVDPTVAFMGATFLFVGWGIALGYLSFIATGFIGSSLSVLGTANDTSALKDVGDALSGKTGQTIGGVVLVVAWWAIVVANISWAKAVMRTLTVAALVATLIALVTFLLHSGGSTTSAFDGLWGRGTHDGVMAAAQKNGWKDPGFSFSETIKSLLVVAGAYAGLEAISYAGGEIKSPRRSAMVGWLSGYAASALLFVIVAWAVFHSYGNFIEAYDFLNTNKPDVLSSVMPASVQPSIPFYAASLIGSAWVGGLLIIVLTFWLMNTMLPFFVGSSRVLFALAMDRAVPEQLAKVSARTSSPTLAAHLTLVVGLFGVLAIRNGIVYALGIILFCVFFQWPFYGLAALQLPYSRKDLYELSPVQSRFLGVPVLSILGALVFVLGLFLLLNAVTGMTTSAILLLLAISAVALAINIYQRARLGATGIDQNITYAQLPPE